MEKIIFAWFWIVLGYFILSSLIGLVVKTLLFLKGAEEKNPLWLFTTQLILAVIMANLMVLAITRLQPEPESFAGYAIIGISCWLIIWFADKDIQKNWITYAAMKLSEKKWIRKLFKQS